MTNQIKNYILHQVGRYIQKIKNTEAISGTFAWHKYLEGNLKCDSTDSCKYCCHAIVENNDDHGKALMTHTQVTQNTSQPSLL